MAQAIDIKFKIVFDFSNSPKDFSFTDLIGSAYNTTYGYTLVDVKGLIKVVSPSGVTVYANAGYGTDNYASPDITVGGSWTKDLGSLPLDSDGEVETGTYVFYYKLSVNGGTSTYVTTSKTYDLGNYTSPEVEIDMSVACRTSELTSTDSTDYTISVESENIEPTIVRAHKIVKPDGAACTIPVDASTDQKTRTIGGGGTVTTDIYTGVWQTTLTSSLTYDMDTWGTYTWIQIVDEVTGYETLDVECADCLCDINSCIEALYDKWIAAVGVESKIRVDQLRDKNLKVAMNWIQYEAAERCGEDSSSFCDAIAAILVSENCTCGSSDDTVPTRVVAWGSSTGTGSTPAAAAAILNGAADPTSGIGSNGDYYIQTTAMTLWYKSAGEWTSLGSIKGDDGSAGTTYYSVLENDVSDDGVSAVSSEQVLKSYTVTAGALTPNGSFLKVRSVIQLSASSETRTLKAYWDGAEVGSYVVTGTVNTYTNTVELEMVIDRVGAASQFVTCKWGRKGTPGFITGVSYASKTSDLTGAVDIEISGESDPGGADSIIVKNLKVELFKTVVIP